MCPTGYYMGGIVDPLECRFGRADLWAYTMMMLHCAWLIVSNSHRKSLDLVESLLRLSEVGQYEQVKQLFGFPIKHCPDMLVLALLQISTSWHTLRHELISTLMPIFLGNHPNSAIILHYAWHGQVGGRNCLAIDGVFSPVSFWKFHNCLLSCLVSY